MKCNIKNKECVNATPFGGCWSTDCLQESYTENSPKTRLKEELDELIKKINKLECFMKSNTFVLLEQSSRDDLLEQYHIMMSYKMVLQRRLKNWKDIK